MRQRWSGLLAAGLVSAGILSGTPGAGAASPTLSPVDDMFVGLTFLGNRFQVDTGRLAGTRASDPAVQRYGRLMETSHVAVENKLVAVLQRISAEPPPASLLSGAYASLVRNLGAAHGNRFDREYMADQVDYQEANDALYRWELANGSSSELKQYATEVLPKIDDHLGRARALARAAPSR